MQIEDSIISTEYGDGILIEEYQGQYGLVATTRGNNDVNYKIWVFLSKWNSGKPVPDDKKRPVSVRLGSDPVKILEQLITELKRMKGV